MKRISKDKCVYCGKDSEHPKTQNINARNYYVEGVGQLCGRCHNKIYKNKKK